MPEKIGTIGITSDDNILKSASRRNFIKGVIAGGVAASSASYLFRASTLLGQLPPGLGDRLIALNVNGQQRRVDVMKQETLAWTLRYKLGLTGTKLGCDRAECGACTVLIDDVPHYSCSVLTHTVRERKVVTIEGLASSDGTLHPVQQGVIDEQGFQCAFCMSGFIMSAVAHSHPDFPRIFRSVNNKSIFPRWERPMRVAATASAASSTWMFIDSRKSRNCSRSASTSSTSSTVFTGALRCRISIPSIALD